jgi:restriction system protein
MATGRGKQSDWQRRQQALARQAERQRKEAERARIAAEKERQRQYVEVRMAEVDHKNRLLDETVEQLRDFLCCSLNRSARINLEAARRVPQLAPLNLGIRANPVPVPQWDHFAFRSPGVLSRAFGGSARYVRRVAEARERYEQAVRDAERQEIERQQQVVVARREHAARAQLVEAEAKKHNKELDVHIRGLTERKPADVEMYLQQVLKPVPLPKGFPRNAEITFNPRVEQAIVRFELPQREVVPTIGSHRYLSTKDEERTTNRNKVEVGELYRRVISQVALLCVRDLFDSDSALNSIGFNGHVHAINPATGEREYPCIISLNVERAAFPKDENLRQVTAERCVRHLSAIVSNHPYDLEPIEPILDFDLSKFSFIDGFDAVSTLDSRPDLMDMSYTNFEHLVRQIFEAQGAEGWTTQQSNDDGVDAVIVQRRALMGGLSIVQAKRYSKAIGVNHIRELAGAMEEKKAGWGILITTSWFTVKCWEKAREHGRMELIDGERLKYLIKEHLNKDVLIGIPNRPQSRADQDGSPTS